MKKNVILLIAIIFLAFIFRIYQLSHVPPSASLDEVSIGWNAYSILQTGKDEFGYKFPILLRAYDDFRPALYVYLVIPFIKILGLSVLAVRLPSVLLSVLTIISSYFLVKILFAKYKYKEYLSLFVTFLMSISPWNIYISRLGHEANAGLAFALFGILFFIKSMEEKGKEKWLMLSAFWFALSFYTYQSAKVFTPLIFFVLCLIYSKKLWKTKKIVFFSLCMGILLSLPIIASSLSPNALVRLSGTSAFDSNNPLYYESAKKSLDAKNHGDTLGKVINNRRVTSLHIFLLGYTSHLNPSWVFGNSGVDAFKAPGVGLLNIWEAPFLIIGIFLLFTKRYSTRAKAIILSWSAASLVAPAISTQAPHAMRAYSLLPVPQILTGVGFISAVIFLKRQIRSKFLINTIFLLGAAVIFWQCLYFAKQYFIVFPKEESSFFEYALSQAVPFVLKHESSYDKIIVSNRKYLGQSYMFFLFYSKYDPFLYQKQGGTKSGGFDKTHYYGKYEFRKINWEKETLTRRTLYVGNVSSFPKDEPNLAVFDNLDGVEAIRIIGRE